LACQPIAPKTSPWLEKENRARFGLAIRLLQA
jgi:hypothetical protein